MKKIFAIFALAVGLMGASAVGATPKATPVVIHYSEMEGSNYDPEISRELFAELTQSGLSTREFTPVITNKKPTDATSWLRISATHLYVAGSDTRVLMVTYGVMNKAGHQVCDITASIWRSGPSGGQRLREHIANDPKFVLKECLGLSG